MQLVVIGGGTAGWITALMLREMLPALTVTLIASKELGILGAGEGVTPHFIGQFLDEVNIPVSEVFKHAGATLKHGVKFTNWNGDGGHYFHPFDDAVTPDLDLGLLHPGEPLERDDLNFSAYASARQRVLFSKRHAHDARNGGGDPGGRHRSAADHTHATSSASAGDKGGSRPGSRRASIVFPHPGGPINSRW